MTRTEPFFQEQEFALTASPDRTKRSDIPNRLLPPKIGRRIGRAPGHRVEVLASGNGPECHRGLAPHISAVREQVFAAALGNRMERRFPHYALQVRHGGAFS